MTRTRDTCSESSGDDTRPGKAPVSPTQQRRDPPPPVGSSTLGAEGGAGASGRGPLGVLDVHSVCASQVNTRTRVSCTRAARTRAALGHGGAGVSPVTVSLTRMSG